MVSFDDTALGQSVPINVHVFRPMVEFGEMADSFGFNEFTRTVFVLHQRKKVTVLDASLELELAVVACLGFVKDVPWVDTTGSSSAIDSPCRPIRFSLGTAVGRDCFKLVGQRRTFRAGCRLGASQGRCRTRQ